MERETTKRIRNMKVVCANLGENLGYKTNVEGITIGKSYDIVYQQQQYMILDVKMVSLESMPLNTFDNPYKIEFIHLIGIKNDRDQILPYNQKLFVSLEEWREIQLQKIEI